jgi:hypothetical protein
VGEQLSQEEADPLQVRQGKAQGEQEDPVVKNPGEQRVQAVAGVAAQVRQSGMALEQLRQVVEPESSQRFARLSQTQSPVPLRLNGGSQVRQEVPSSQERQAARQGRQEGAAR